MTTPSAAPWYRHRWPWFLMAGPAIAVVASIGTAVLAIETNDPVVADDYYRQGLAINETLGREQHARDLGVTARLQFNEEATRVRVLLASREPTPPALRLSLIHPARSGEDQVVVVSSTAPGVFEGSLRPPREGHWGVELEDAAATWRLEGEWRTGTPQVMLGEAGR
ncbi:MAG TPA: FixH family protein [Usitatibacter sp.]|jgi:hypothetical protein|nr:FixH family protein [Usitatibacter sp.]